MNSNDIYRYIREEVRDSKPMLEFYRSIREIRDKIAGETRNKIQETMEWFAELPLERQLELIEGLYAVLFKEKDNDD